MVYDGQSMVKVLGARGRGVLPYYFLHLNVPPYRVSFVLNRVVPANL